MDIKAKFCLMIARIMKPYNFKRFGISFEEENEGIAIYNNGILIGYDHDMKQAELHAMIMCMSEYLWVQKVLVR